MNLNFNFNVSGRLEVHHRVEGVDRVIHAILKLGESIMALSQELKDLTAKIDDATNKVAARLDTLAGQIKNSMTDQEVADVKAGLEAEADRLTALGADPNNPVPPTP